MTRSLVETKMAALVIVVTALVILPSVRGLANTPTPPPAHPSGVAAPSPPPAVATPGVAVAAVKQVGGVRLSRLLGSSVLDDRKELLGSVDDIIADDQHKLSLAVIQVGGFLGIGSKLIAVPFDTLTWVKSQATLPNVTKESVRAMPAFVYTEGGG